MPPYQTIQLKTAYVTLASKNLPCLVEFYQGLLDQSPQVYVPERYAEFRLPGLKLALFKPKDGQEFVGAAGSISLCLEVEDLEGAIATLTTLGYPPPGNIMHASHGQEIYAYDSAGNRLILHQSS
ncbi:MAG: glyoxalase [Cyanobacteria bacterium P01_H01_bin.105]